MRRRSITGACALIWCVLSSLAGLSAPAVAAEAPPYFASFGPDGTESTGFGKAGPIAVDQQANLVYVVDHGNGSLLKFDLEGQPANFTGTSPDISGNAITGLSLFPGIGEAQVAVDSTTHNIYVTSGNAVRAFEGSGEPYDFVAGPGAGSSEITGFGELLGVAVDMDGNIYAADYAGLVRIYDPSGEFITEFSASTAANIAVASTGVVYVNRWHGTVTAFTPSESPVTTATTYAEAAQPLDSNASYTVATDPATDDVYVAHEVITPGIAWYGGSGTLLDTFAQAGEEGEVRVAEGIGVGDQDGRVFVSNDPGGGLSQVEIFFEAIYKGVPKVESLSVIDVTGDSATLRARINPGSAETTYRFEYGPEGCAVSACTSIPVIGASVGDGHKGVVVSQNLTGLQADSTYHYRVVAENQYGDNLATEGDHTFKTQPGGIGFQLSDSRIWELVSPSDKHGAQLLGTLNAHMQAAGDGESISYATRGSIEPEPEGNRTAEASTVLARRGAAGWTSKDITLSNDSVTPIAVGSQSEFKLFSRNLSRGLVEPRTTQPHSLQATERTPYLRENTEPPAFTPLITAGNVPSGTEFGGDPASSLGPVNIAAATPDLSHVVLSSQVPLVEGAPPAPADGLYLWAAGQLRPVSVLPTAEGGGMAVTNIVGSGSRAISSGHTVEHAISDDGSRIFWSAADLSALYLRDVSSEETVRLDVEQPGATGAGVPEPIFQGASADGTVVFFADSQQLTADASPTGRDLYRCEIPLGFTASASGCSTLEDITSSTQSSGESSEAQGLIAGLSDDGSTIYFVARGVLDEGANENAGTAVAGQPNLYAWQLNDGVRYIATLSEDDNLDWGGEVALAARRTAAVSPNGRYLSFMADHPLAGNSVFGGQSEEAVHEVYRYDLNMGRLDCLSCKATGAAPEGELVGELKFIDPRGLWQGDRVSAVLPEPTIVDVITEISLYRPRTVLDNGRVYFNAVDSLVPADINRGWDVYQYEPVGVGDCSQYSDNAATATMTGGCVSLVSSGTGREEAAFLDASETGNDVFFLTPEELSAADEDSEFDVYDARVGGVPAGIPSGGECTGESCQNVSPPPSDSTPASATFQGRGNAKQHTKHCHKRKQRARRHGKAVCVRRKRHAIRNHHRQGGNNRGARG